MNSHPTPPACLPGANSHENVYSSERKGTKKECEGHLEGGTDKFFLEHLLYLLFSNKAKQLSIAMTTKGNLVVGGAEEN